MSLVRTIAIAGFALAFAAGMTVRGGFSAMPVAYAQATGPVVELRTYTAAPGKMDALNARFRNHTIRIFAKHGIKNVAYWAPVDGPLAANTLIYTLSFPSRAAATKFWADFQADPEWIKAKADSEANGPLTTKVESLFMKATDYSGK